MRKGEKDLVSAVADAEPVHNAGDVRSPVHAALQNRAADDEVTTNNSAIKPTCHFKDNIALPHLYFSPRAQYVKISFIQKVAWVWCLMYPTRVAGLLQASQPDQTRHRDPDSRLLTSNLRLESWLAKNWREETQTERSEEFSDSLGRVSYPRRVRRRVLHFTLSHSSTADKCVQYSNSSKGGV